MSVAVLEAPTLRAIAQAIPACRACGLVICDHSDPEYAGIVPAPKTPTRDLLTAPDREGCDAVPADIVTNAARDRATDIGVNGTEPGTFLKSSAVPLTHGAGGVGHVAPTGMASTYPAQGGRKPGEDFFNNITEPSGFNHGEQDNG